MSPGIYDHLRKTGTLPKSNRGSDRNRERDRSSVNQNRGWVNGAYPTTGQHSNNLAPHAQSASLVSSVPNAGLRSTSAHVKEHTWSERRRNERSTSAPKLAATPRIPSRREASGPSPPAQVSFVDATTDSSVQFQLDWHPVSERQPPSARPSAKNSNARTSTSPYAQSASSAFDLPDIGLYNSHSRLYPNVYTREDLFNWLKMTPPLDSRTEFPQNLTAKPTNTDKMPERSQVEGRLNQIREYINVTSKMMDSLSQSSDPRAQTQHEKLGRMLDDLYDSEQKLSKLMEDCQKYWRSNEVNELTAHADYRNAVNEMENSEDMREQELRKKVEESQRKLAQLQEHQAHLVGMQLHMRERLNEAREAQRALLEEGETDNQQATPPAQVTPANVDRLERETEALRGKLQQLENKKRHMDQLVQELQAVELVERGSCSSDGCRANGQRDKAAELETMKAQLAHLKALMGDALINGDDDPPVREPEDVRSVHSHDAVTADDDASYHEDEAQHYSEQRSNPPTVEQIQAVTQELKEQQQLLQTARAELKRLKQAQPQPPPAPSVTLSATPPPPAQPIEKKRSNNISGNTETRLALNKRRQLEEFMRKDQSQGLRVNQNGGPAEWNSSRRGSNSQYSHTSVPGNVWPPAANINGSQEHSMDGIAAAENLMEIGSQPQMENGFSANFWSVPPVMTNQLPQGFAVGSAEYYKQLLIGSQAQQLQMMSTTIQQCCQLLWSQQREMQTMKAAIAQLQGQLRHSQLSEDQHSNLGRAAAGAPAASQHFSGLDAGAPLPPSSSLPNLVSLPSTSPTPASITPAPCQQQQQLNNQVPPGNRANNYWDNFRSYSRQNLLSGSSKSVSDYVTGASAHAASSTDIATVATSTHVNNKRNRHHLDNLPLPSGAGASEAQYSLNLQAPPQISQQQQGQSHSQQQDRESPSSARRDAQPQQPVQNPLDIIIRKSPIATLPLEVVQSYASSETSDNESEAGACGNSVTISNNENIHNEGQGLPVEFIELCSTSSDQQNPSTVSRLEKYTVKPAYKNSLCVKSEASSNNNEVCNEVAKDLVDSSCMDEVLEGLYEVGTTSSLPGNYCADDKEWELEESGCEQTFAEEYVMMSTPKKSFEH